jgi:hypothetical protein
MQKTLVYPWLYLLQLIIKNYEDLGSSKRNTGILKIDRMIRKRMLLTNCGLFVKNLP